MNWISCVLKEGDQKMEEVLFECDGLNLHLDSMASKSLDAPNLLIAACEGLEKHFRQLQGTNHRLAMLLTSSVSYLVNVAAAVVTDEIATHRAYLVVPVLQSRKPWS